ncbi:MAG: hypothetical protein KC619_02680 [Myxococcales bacterium]|nr:hypothetical protein [Myxococcales bacterium]
MSYAAVSRLALASLLLAACDGTTPADAGAPSDGAVAEDAAVDAAAPFECDFPAAMVGGTTESDALADAPARCGQPAHTWLRDPALGTITAQGSLTRYSVAVLRGLVAGVGVTLPRDPEESVALREYRYQTQDRGVLVETTATVAYPETRVGDTLDVILSLHGTSGFTAGCGPSEDESGLLAAILASYGFVVVMPDYLGLEWGAASYGELHPYLSGQATAIASLDAVRAAARLTAEERGNSCMSTRLITFGGSQGGHATLWVDRLLPYYARELEPIGAIATVPPADLHGQIVRGLTEVVSATANVAAMFSTLPFWYGAGDRLDEVYVSPFDTELPAALRAECSPSSFDGVTALTDVFTSSVLDAAAAGTFDALDPWGCYGIENGLTTTSIARISEDAPSYGVLFVTGEADGLVHTPLERESFRTLCEGGMPLSYLECAGAEHGETTFWALPEILDFIDARVAGTPFTVGSCEPTAAVTCRGMPAP